MKRIRLFLIILAIFGVGWGAAHGRSVEECPQGIVEVFEPGKLDLRTETIPLCKSSVHYKAILDGVVVGEASFPVEDLDVIIQMEGEPLAQLKGKKMPILSAVADLERAQDRLKEEILRVENEARQAKGLAAQTLREGIKREFRYVFPGLAARVSREAIPQIESIPGVKKVWLDRKVKALLSESVPLIGANRVWNEMGAKGRGIIVAVIDTGIDYTHPDLGGCFGPGCKVVGGYDFVNHDPNPMDDNGHGTHVAGIVAANGTLQGVAPEAKLMAFKVLDKMAQDPSRR